MKDVLLQRAIKLNRNHKQRKWWQRMVRTMAMAVVFCTTYALILPAITMEQDTLCGKSAHTHGEDCYEQRQVSVLECGIGDGACVIHSHNEFCRDAQGTLICPLPELGEHTHGEDCYARDLVCTYSHEHSAECSGTQRILFCGLEESEGHAHTESCGSTKTVVTCTQPETEPHVHGEDCAETEDAPACEKTEDVVHTHGDDCYYVEPIPCEIPVSEGHVHEDACYTETELVCDMPSTGEHLHADACYENALICGLEEVRQHIHGEGCYDAEANLICQLPELEAHVHTGDCLICQEELHLICGQEEHIHEDACYPAAEETQGPAYICGLGVHAHVEDCFNAEGILTCTIPEHGHDLSCIVEGYDLTADVETEEQWKETFSAVTLTGRWPEDVLAVAQTQLGYQESTKNVIQTEDGTLKGYTRYGSWYGIPYGDWCAMYASFCLRYAGVEDYPLESGVGRWIEALTEAEYYSTSELYAGKPGDLIFFDLDQRKDAAEEIPVEADHVGIVAELIPATEEEPAKIKTIEGNANDEVAYVTYELDDPAIIGYGVIPIDGSIVKTFAGEDFEVTVTYDRNAALPRNVELAVQEILPGTEAYETYYRQSQEALIGDAEELELSFARFFDITFLADGVEVEPAAPVKVQIRYTEAISMAEEDTGLAIHFAEDGIEVLNADTYTADAGELGEEPVSAEQGEDIPQPETQVDTFVFTQSSFSVVGTVLAADGPTVDVWLDGTCGGLMAYTGAANRRVKLENGVLPTEWDAPTRYGYTLRGWYDVTNSKYYPAGATVSDEVKNNTVFYADWVVADDSIGYDNGRTVNSLDTSEFITTHVFDYNALFNVQSSNATVESNKDRHSENWSLVEAGAVKYNNAATLDFIFRDHDSNSNPAHLTHPSIPDGGSQINEPGELNAITPGIYSDSLKKILFTPSNAEEDFVVGRDYLGQGNYLYQYQDDPADTHYGYYYYDSFKNAASYNAAEQRFYIYDYLEYTQDTINNGYEDTNADFLPLNMAGADLSEPVVYASLEDQSGGLANFFFGMTSNIHFFLPNDAGEQDANGNYKNKSTTGDNMVFEFFGDDDVWVLLDGELLLDIGGIHMVRGGKIDFSEGKVYTSKAGAEDFREYDVRTFEEILGHAVEDGPHDLTICYLERGSSMSNCAIYFNLAPRYGLDLTKRDFTSGELMDGVTFKVYNDEACNEEDLATLWHSHDDAKNNLAPATEFTTVNGVAHLWGFVAGKTYYIKEVGVPEGYEPVDALIRVTLNNHGTDVAEVTVIRKGEDTAGFEVTSNTMDKEKHQISMTLTNRKTEDSITAIRAEKKWDSSVTVLTPVQVYLKANGVQKGDPVTLSVDNAWGHTWLDLPAQDAAGQPIVYTVDEVYLPGYNKDGIETTVLQGELISWAKVGALENDATFLLRMGSGDALTASGTSFGSIAWEYAEETPAAYWTAEAYQDGFRISSNGAHLTFDGTGFYLTTATTESTGINHNQIFYYDGTYLFVMANNNRYCLGLYNGGTVTPTDQSTGLYKQVVTPIGTTVFTVNNSMTPEDRQKDLRVEKLWVSEADKIPESIQVHLKKGDEIITTLELSEANDWTSVVKGLDEELLLNNGYTLEEVVPFGFAPEYGQIRDVSVNIWHRHTDSSSLETGKTYIFVSGSRALADNGTGPAMTDYNGTPAENQQWIVVEASGSNGTIQVLRNVATNRYLREYNKSWEMTDTADNNCRVRLIQSRLQYNPSTGNDGGWSIRVSGDGSLGASGWGYRDGTAFDIYWHEYQAMYQVTVTNTYGVYRLPDTGGMGTQYHTFAGLLMLAAGCVYSIIHFGRKRQKGGARSSR